MFVLLMLLQADLTGAVEDALQSVLGLADPRIHAAQAIRKTRGATNFETAIQSTLAAQQGKPLGQGGTGQVCAPGIVILDLKADGGKTTQAVRVGSEVWVYSALHDLWLYADEAGEASIASGLTNPEHLLRLLEDIAPDARFLSKDLQIQLRGAPAVAWVKKLNPLLDVANVRLDLILKRASDGRISSVTIDAAIQNAQGKGNLKAEVRLGRFGQVPLPSGVGNALFNKKIQTAIQAHLNLTK